MNQNKNNKLLIAIILVDSFISLFWLYLIPSDPKNAFFLGFSKLRWIQGIFIIIASITLLFYFAKNSIFDNSRKLINKIISERKDLFGVISFLILLLIILTPAYRLSPYSAEFVRLKPILYWIFSIGSIIYFFALYKNNQINFDFVQFGPLRTRKFISFFFLLFMLFGIWIFFGNISKIPQISKLVFSPPAPITSFQIFFLISVFFFIFSKNNVNVNNWFNSKWIPILLFFVTFIIWYSIPVSCTNDLIGPFPPNYLCYPKSSDAIYSIASHYGRLGNGIYNQWFTDKPLYIFFLMVLQWISSPKITDYLTFQLLVFALFPSIAFIFLRRIFNWKYGLLFSTLLIIHEVNQITGYQYFGGVNTKFESTEIFTAMILLLFSIITFYWFINPRNKSLAVLSGVSLGFASLARLNPLLIFPFILISVFLGKSKKIIKSPLTVFLFILGFFSVFSPWYVFSVDNNGQNFLLKKMEDVIGTRYEYFFNKETLPESTINNNTVGIKIDPALVNVNDKENQTILNKIFFHFMNNFYHQLFILPTSFSFDTLDHIAENPIWKNYEGSPIWKFPLSTQNIYLLIINLFIIYIGIRNATSKFGISGLVPLFTQFGYILGNSLALTSGNRYILPIIWITFLYYTIGVVYIIKIILKLFSKRVTIIDHNFDQLNTKNPTNSFLYLFMVIIFALFSFGLTKLNLIPDRIPKSTEIISVDQLEVLGEYFSPENFDKFIENNEIRIYQGISYQPKYYRNYFYNEAPESFELITLTNDVVILSYIRDFPTEYFSDESTTTIIGCPVKEENRWGSIFIIVDALIIQQNDNEESLFISPTIDLGCIPPN